MFGSWDGAIPHGARYLPKAVAHQYVTPPAVRGMTFVTDWLNPFDTTYDRDQTWKILRETLEGVIVCPVQHVQRVESVVEWGETP